MIKRTNPKTEDVAMYLAMLTLSGKKLTKRCLSDEQMEEVYKYAKNASIGAITYAAIEDTLSFDESNDESSFYFKWKRLRLNALRRNLLFDKETKMIIDFLEQNGIWYMPLKGLVVRDFYPSSDLREMNDNDILVDNDGRADIKKFMLSNGYILKASDRFKRDFEGTKEELDEILRGKDSEMFEEYMKNENADEYVKEPFYYFEMHKFLMEENTNPVQSEYYNNIKDRLVKDEDNKYGYHFTPEDNYIYIVSHAYKHFIKNGIGVRFLMDVYVCLKHNKLDFDYILKVSDEFGMKSFEADARDLALKVFDPGEEISEEKLSEAQRKMYDSILGADTFGNLETRWKNQMYELDAEGQSSKSQKVKYIKSRVIPDERWFRMYHPFVHKHKIVKPFFIVYRVTVMLFRGRKKVKKEMDQMMK